MVFCSNCQSEIEDNKMILHERFCKMNIKYCFQCKEKIPIEEYEEHIKNHNEKKPENKEDEFKNEIKEEVPYTNNKEDNLNIECQYCSLLVDPSELEEHEKMCGARTVKCDICGKYIYIRLIKQHMNVIHDMGYKDIDTGDNENDKDVEQYKKECEKRKQIEEDEILARKLAEEYRNNDMFNAYSRRYF